MALISSKITVWCGSAFNLISSSLVPLYIEMILHSNLLLWFQLLVFWCWSRLKLILLSQTLKNNTNKHKLKKTLFLSSFTATQTKLHKQPETKTVLKHVNKYLWSIILQYCWFLYNFCYWNRIWIWSYFAFKSYALCFIRKHLFIA